MGYGTWLHGEAVAAGTMMLPNSPGNGMADRRRRHALRILFKRAGLPVQGPGMEVARYLELMQHDKKVQDGVLRLVLLRGGRQGRRL